MPRLLLPVDGSPASQRAVELVCGYAGERSRIAPLVLNVQRRPLSLWPQPAFDAGALEQALLAQGEQEAAAVRQALAAAGFAVEAMVRMDIPAQAILREAARHGADAIVMGTRGRGGIAALGSVAARVLHGASVPTLLVRQEARLPAALGRRLRALVPVDGSEHALNAAARLASWSDWLGELYVDILFVQEPLTPFAVLLPTHREMLEQWSGREAEQATRGARQVFAATQTKSAVHSVSGDPAESIVRFAGEAKSDLVFMGTRGRGAAHHALVGSVALKVAQASAVPVALVP